MKTYQQGGLWCVEHTEGDRKIVACRRDKGEAMARFMEMVKEAGFSEFENIEVVDLPGGKKVEIPSSWHQALLDNMFDAQKSPGCLLDSTGTALPREMFLAGIEYAMEHSNYIMEE